MDFGPTMAVFIIAGFVLFMLWGRSANGQAWFTRVYGTPTTAQPAKRASKRRSSRASASSKPVRTRGRSTTKRGRTK